MKKEKISKHEETAIKATQTKEHERGEKRK